MASYPEATFEQSISGKLLQQDWTFSLNGRMDQLLPETDSLIIREVKTVRHSLPCPPEDLNMEYPAYFIQAALYLRLARLLPEYATKKIKAELLFIEISSGVAQIVPLGTYCDELADRQLERLVAFLDERRARRIA
ncbi:MAG: helicase, partial [Opitutales bacterium]